MQPEKRLYDTARVVLRPIIDNDDVDELPRVRLSINAGERLLDPLPGVIRRDDNAYTCRHDDRHEHNPRPTFTATWSAVTCQPESFAGAM